MLELLAPLLSGGAKGFFENASYLIGIPLAALGALGVFIALSPVELRWPEQKEYVEPELLPAPEGHPTALVYMQVGLVLAAVTAIEVVVYYVDIVEGAFLGILLVLSLLKFVLVVLWFMHLRFDSRLFSIAFTGALALAASLFIVVLATLGSSLV